MLPAAAVVGVFWIKTLCNHCFFADRGGLNPAGAPLIKPEKLFRQTEPALFSSFARWAATRDFHLPSHGWRGSNLFHSFE
jgi:hypothetical protein